MQSKTDIRRNMRKLRRSLPVRARRGAARQLARRLLATSAFRRARRIACFVSTDGEIDTGPLIREAWRLGKHMYLPVLVPFGPKRLWFRRYRQDTPLVRNRYGIVEPRGGRRLSGRELDLALAPLVAFDRHGRRLGMGGGYYDRTFTYLHRSRWQRPRLLGLAYAFQQVEALPAEPWDVPLWGVVTEQALHRFQHENEEETR
jgi:5-formyltetrahydrofolate cyclo-ligase